MITKTTLLAFVIATSVFSAFANAKVPESFHDQYELLEQSFPKMIDQVPFPQDCGVEFLETPTSPSVLDRFLPQDKLFAESACGVPLPDALQFRDIARRDIV